MLPENEHLGIYRGKRCCFETKNKMYHVPRPNDSLLTIQLDVHLLGLLYYQPVQQLNVG